MGTLSRIRSWWTSVFADRTDVVEYPKIARIQIAHLPCRLCGGALHDGDLVVWFEKKNGWRSDYAHAGCAVFIWKPDGAIVRLSGEVMAAGVCPPGTLLLTDDEWKGWVGMARERGVG